MMAQTSRSQKTATKNRVWIPATAVYPGADGDFTLFADDGNTYAYENGTSSITKLHWDNTSQ